MPNWTSMSGGCGQLDEEEQRKMKKEGKRQKNNTAKGGQSIDIYYKLAAHLDHQTVSLFGANLFAT